MRTTKFWVILLALTAAFVLIPAVYAKDNSATSKITVTGTLSSISTTTPPATLVVSVSGTDYTVNVTDKTTIVRKFNGKSGLEEFMIGDTLEIRGTTTAVANTINATRIKDRSLQRIGGTFQGTIGTIDCTASTFTFKPRERAQQTVYLTSATKILRLGEKITCTDLVEGEKAVVIGLWRRASSRIDADRVIVHPSVITGTITGITLTDGSVPATITINRNNGKKSTRTWTISVTAKTRLLLKGMKSATINQFGIGDKVQAFGVVTAPNALKAVMLRNQSFEKSHSAKLLGSVALRGWKAGYILNTKNKVHTTSSVADVALRGWGRAFARSGNYLYVADGPAGLQVVDVSNPKKPKVVGSLVTGTYASSIAVSGNYAYVGDNNSMLIVDVSTPTAPTLVGTFTDTARIDTPRDIAINSAGTLAALSYVAQEVLLVDVSSPASPVLVKRYFPEDVITSSTAWQGTILYLSGSGDGIVEVVDFTTPSAPVKLATYTTTTFTYVPLLRVVNSTLYAGDQSDGLEVYDATTPASLVQIAQFKSGFLWDIVVSGNMLYLLDNNSTI